MRFEDLEGFRARAAGGDDFAIDAIKFGKLLHDGLGCWLALQREMVTAKWPDWRAKLRSARRRIEMADKLAGSGDLDAAAEEYLLAATQIARAKLLRKGIFPMSRPQLSRQLDLAGEADLAREMQELSEGRFLGSKMREISKSLASAIGQ